MNHPTHQPETHCPAGRTAAATGGETAQQHQSSHPCPEWLQMAIEHFYTEYAASSIRQHQEVVELSKRQEVIENQLKSVLTPEQYQLVLEWEEMMNQRRGMELDGMYEVGVKVGIRIEQEYRQYTQLP